MQHYFGEYLYFKEDSLRIFDVFPNNGIARSHSCDQRRIKKDPDLHFYAQIENERRRYSIKYISNVIGFGDFQKLYVVLFLKQFVRTEATSSVGQKCLEKPCPTSKSNGRPCRGKLHDTILDWEHNLPEKDLGLADFHSCLADLSICLGTTLQIVPSGVLPLNTKKYNGGRLVICNLQPTKYDRKADLLIHSYVDDVMSLLIDELRLVIPEHDLKLDPSTAERNSFVEWTIPDEEVKRMRLLYEQICCKTKKKLKTKGDVDHDTNIKTESLEYEEKSKKRKLLKNEEQNDSGMESKELPTFTEAVIKQEKNDIVEEPKDNSLLDSSFNNSGVNKEIISF